MKTLRTRGLFNFSAITTRLSFSIHLIKQWTRSYLAFWYWFPGEVPLTTKWVGELIAWHLVLLLLRYPSESGKGSHASMSLKNCPWRVLPELIIWNGKNLGNYASPETADTVGDGTADKTADHLVPLQVVLLPHTAESPLSHNEVEFAFAGVVDLTRTSDWRLIGLVGMTRIWSNEAAYGIFIVGAGLEVGFAFVVGLVAVFDYLAVLGGAFFSVVVALRVTVLCSHEMRLCIVWTSSLIIFPSGVSPRRSWAFSASVSQMSVHCYLSGQCQSMSEIHCQKLNVRDSMSETHCQRLNIAVGFTNLVMGLCNALQLGVRFDIGVRRDRGFVMLSFPFLDCCKAFSECRPATHSIDVMGSLHQHRATDIVD